MSLILPESLSDQRDGEKSALRIEQIGAGTICSVMLSRWTSGSVVKKSAVHSETVFLMRHAICLLLVLPLMLSAQAPEPSLQTTVSEVLLDVVVRDKKAHIIRDLRPEEVQVFENGVPQTIRHFEFFDGHSTPMPSPTGRPGTTVAASSVKVPAAEHDVNELRDISVVSVVVAELDPRGRKASFGYDAQIRSRSTAAEYVCRCLPVIFRRAVECAVIHK